MSRILNFLAPCGPQQQTNIYLPIVVKEIE